MSDSNTLNLTEEYVIDRKRQIQNKQMLMDISSKCLFKCVKSFDLQELTKNQRLCIEGCAFESLENLNLSKINISEKKL